jgi:hypothetical protein
MADMSSSYANVRFWGKAVIALSCIDRRRSMIKPSIIVAALVMSAAPALGQQPWAPEREDVRQGARQARPLQRRSQDDEGRRVRRDE